MGLYVNVYGSVVAKEEITPHSEGSDRRYQKRLGI